MSKSTNNKDMIGKGLRSLLQNIDAEYKNPAGRVETETKQKAVATNRIALSDIQVNPKNPRKDFDEIYNLPNKFFFYPAQFWPHKNHMLLLSAISILKNIIPEA